MDNAKTHVYWGEGKGKTTSSLGLALRALGHGLKVHLVQFMKCGIENSGFEDYGELEALKKFSSFSMERFGAKEWLVGKPSQKHISEAKNALVHSLECVSSGEFDLLILDEVLYAIQLGLLNEDDVCALVDSRNEITELVLTGSHRPIEKIFAKADLITEMKKQKHYFDSGVNARKGVEF